RRRPLLQQFAAGKRLRAWTTPPDRVPCRRATENCDGEIETCLFWSPFSLEGGHSVNLKTNVRQPLESSDQCQIGNRIAPLRLGGAGGGAQLRKEKSKFTYGRGFQPARNLCFGVDS